MRNPYEAIIALIRGQVGPAPAFAPFVATLTSEKPLRVSLFGEPVDTTLGKNAALELTEEDVGCEVLCLPHDGGVVVLCRL